MPETDTTANKGERSARIGCWLHAEDGSTGMVFGLMLACTALFVGIAIDVGMGVNENLRQQNALDAATLAGSHKLGSDNEQADVSATVNAYYQANTRDVTRGSLEPIAIDGESGGITAVSNGFSFTSIMNLFGYQQMTVRNRSLVSRGNNTIEMALVLDNSGSMGGQPLTDLKAAAKNLLNGVFVGAGSTDKVSAALVPFAGSVNVGSQYAAAPWIDTAGTSSIHNQNVNSPRTRFQLLADMGVSWGGCVEARPAPYELTDTVPRADIPDTQFVPMFAPDEPDPVNAGGKSYYNNYLNDDGGTCTPLERQCTAWSRRGNCTSEQVVPIAPAEAQGRLCKYVGQSPQAASGPNYNCTTQPILPLTTTKSDIVTSIDSMIASGTTNIAEAMMWGMRVLSPGEPFTQGRASNDDNNKKYIVLMTDGENTYSAYDNQNKSWYGAYGYAAKNRISTTYSSSSILAALNLKTIAACNAAKAAGMVVYTVAFRLENDPTSRALLSQCASETTKAFTASNGDALIQVFGQIGREVSPLRLSG